MKCLNTVLGPTRAPGMAVLIYNQKVVGYSHDVCITTVPVNMSCQDSHYCNSQGLKLGKTDDFFGVLVACIAPSSIIKASQWDEAFRSVTT